MRFLIFILFLFLIFGCKNKQEENKLNLLVHKNYFSISENDRKIDSINKIPRSDSREFLEIKKDPLYNEDYHIGAIHFLIVDSTKSFYLINSLENPVLICGNISPLTKQDSLRKVRESIIKISQSKPVNTKLIINILKQNKEKLLAYQVPLQISFALKSDTLIGNSMFKIVKFMEQNKMQLYVIRKMNTEELKKTAQ